MESLDSPENFNGHVGISETRIKSNWERKNTYEYAKFAIDMRMHDPEGSLEVVSLMDRDTCKKIPQVRVVDGFLVIALRREKI